MGLTLCSRCVGKSRRYGSFVAREAGESENEDRSTTQLDPSSLRGLLEDKKPVTALMPRDELRGLIDATAPVQSAAHTVPRVRVRDRLVAESDVLEIDNESDGVSPTMVLVVMTVLIAMFIAIVASN